VETDGEPLGPTDETDGEPLGPTDETDGEPLGPTDETDGEPLGPTDETGRMPLFAAGPVDLPQRIGTVHFEHPRPVVANGQPLAVSVSPDYRGYVLCCFGCPIDASGCCLTVCPIY
jgi:hypothetical protein